MGLSVPFSSFRVRLCHGLLAATCRLPGPTPPPASITGQSDGQQRPGTGARHHHPLQEHRSALQGQWWGLGGGGWSWLAELAASPSSPRTNTAVRYKVSGGGWAGVTSCSWLGAITISKSSENISDHGGLQAVLYNVMSREGGRWACGGASGLADLFPPTPLFCTPPAPRVSRLTSSTPPATPTLEVCEGRGCRAGVVLGSFGIVSVRCPRIPGTLWRVSGGRGWNRLRSVSRPALGVCRRVCVRGGAAKLASVESFGIGAFQGRWSACSTWPTACCCWWTAWRDPCPRRALCCARPWPWTRRWVCPTRMWCACVLEKESLLFH